MDYCLNVVETISVCTYGKWTQYSALSLPNKVMLPKSYVRKSFMRKKWTPANILRIWVAVVTVPISTFGYIRRGASAFFCTVR